MTQLCVVLADAELVTREQVDSIQDHTFITEQRLRDMFSSELIIMPLWEFVDKVNDNELDILTSYFMTYVNLKL